MYLCLEIPHLILSISLSNKSASQRVHIEVHPDLWPVRRRLQLYFQCSSPQGLSVLSSYQYSVTLALYQSRRNLVLYQHQSSHQGSAYLVRITWPDSQGSISLYRAQDQPLYIKSITPEVNIPIDLVLTSSTQLHNFFRLSTTLSFLGKTLAE